MSTKIIITNTSALQAKYGGAGSDQIAQAVRRLVVADAARGLTTEVVFIDDGPAMKAARGKAVARADDAPGAKAAVDAVYRDRQPEYLMILGGLDIVPHQELNNGAFDRSGDDDETVASDLPYACEAPASSEPADFVGPTRVVGRLPDMTGASAAATDPAYLVGLIDRAAGAVSRPAADYAKHFGVSAEIWRQSTEMSLMTMFGAGDGPVRTVPPGGPGWEPADLGARLYFINCHGASIDPNYYGQPASGAEQYPEALRAADLDGAVSDGAVIAAECCYGAQLYDPALAVHAPMVNTALASGAYGFFASSTIAYGPADSNDWADLITRYFLQQVLAGASTGRAALMARQRYVQQGVPMNPVELKTLAQFNLFGDPSVHPVQGEDAGMNGATVPGAMHAMAATAPKTLAGGSAEEAARKMRRAVMLDTGLRLAATTSVCKGRGTSLPAGSLRRALGQAAHQYGVTQPRFKKYRVVSPVKTLYTKARLARGLPNEVHLATEGRHVDALKRREVRTVVAMVSEGKIVSVKVAYSR